MSEKNQPSFHMSPEDFRTYGHQVIDWIAEYMETVEQFPVLSQVAPGEIRSQFPSSPPQQGESFPAILEDFKRIILPGVTHWQSPNFFAFFPSNNSGPSILGELLSAGLGVQGMMWITSPACTELETHLMDWLVEMLDLPKQFLSTSPGGGVIQDTASSASLCALIAAREKTVKRRPVALEKLTAYASSQAHSSIEKAVRIAGLKTENLRLLTVDEKFALRPDLLAKAIEEDQLRGLVPCFACATVGTTSSSALDPLEPIGQLCQHHQIWLHVDAAMSGTAAVCPEFRFIHSGLERADSYCFNPHKWMFVNFDCDCFWVARRADLIGALSILPEYLRNAASESGAVIDYRDWQVPLGRRFRALKLWFVIRHYGVEGLRHHVRHHVRLAQQFRSWVQEDPEFELAAPALLNLVCFRHKGGDDVNQRILDTVNRSGRIYLVHTRLNDQLTLRMSIGQANTDESHVQEAWDLIRSAAAPT